MADSQDDGYYYAEAGEFYDDFCIDVRKKKKPRKKLKHFDPSVANVIKMCPQLCFWPVTLNHFQKLVIDKKILSIADVIKSNWRSIKVLAVVNTKVKPFEELKDKNVVIELLRDETEFKGPIHMYSRHTAIGDVESDESVTSDMRYDHESVTLLRLQNIVISKVFCDSKTLVQVIDENPSKVLQIFQEIMKLVVEVEINDDYFWSYNTRVSKNIFWWNQKWVVLNGDYPVEDWGFIENLLSLLELFYRRGMSKKQLENEFWKAFQDKVWRRRPRFVCRRIQEYWF